MKKKDIENLKLAISFHENIPLADNTVEEEIKAYYDYYRIFCNLGLEELSPCDNRELAKTLQKYIDNTELCLEDITCVCDAFCGDENFKKISDTGFEFDLLETVIRRLSVNEANYKRLMEVVNCFHLVAPYQVLFTKFQSFMDNETAQKYKTNAKEIFEAEVLGFLD